MKRSKQGPTPVPRDSRLKNLLSPAADSRTHFHNWGLKGQRKWGGIVLSWLVIRTVLLSISFTHSYNYKWVPLYASDLTHTPTQFFFTHIRKQRTHTDYMRRKKDKNRTHIYTPSLNNTCLECFVSVLTQAFIFRFTLWGNVFL